MKIVTRKGKVFAQREAEMSPYKHTYASSNLEFSKVIVRRAMWLFSIQTALSLAVIFVRPQSGSQVVMLMSATIPMYAVILGGYFGKAGLENYQKIKNEGSDCEVSDTDNYDMGSIG